MKKSGDMKKIAFILLCCVLTACAVGVAEILVQDPIRKIAFRGSHDEVAQCIHVRLDGKLQRAPFAKKTTVYDSAKSYSHEGLSHYAITALQTGQNRGVVEWRKLPEGAVGERVVSQIWGPVESCVAESKNAR